MKILSPLHSILGPVASSLDSVHLSRLDKIMQEYYSEFLPRSIDLSESHRIAQLVREENILSYSIRPRVSGFSVPQKDNWEALRHSHQYLACFRHEATNVACLIKSTPDKVEVSPLAIGGSAALRSAKRYRWIGANWRVILKSGVATYICVFTSSPLLEKPRTSKEDVSTAVNCLLAAGWSFAEIDRYVECHDEIPVPMGIAQ
nr:hypothetical protein TetV2_00132 [Oceanusvirus sp.]